MGAAYSQGSYAGFRSLRDQAFRYATWATDLVANDSLSCTQFLTISIGLLFVSFIAERMSEFMGDGQVKKVIHSRRPLPDELYAPRRDGTYQRFFKKRLPPIENAKRRAFGVHSVLVLERLPVV
jgi:hypothetical protein